MKDTTPVQTPHRGKIAVAAAALAVTMAGANVAAFAGLAQVFPWMNVWTPAEPVAAAPAPKTRPQVPVTAVTAADPAPAEAVLDAVLETTPARFTGAGWAEASEPDGITGGSFAFACGTPDGPAPVLARTRGWVQATGPLPHQVRSAVTVTAAAYPAGGGAVALEEITTTAASCSQAWATSASGLGVDAVAVYTSGTASVYWRRGDVLMTATVQSAGRAGSLSSISDVTTGFDQVLARSLTEVCVDPDAGSETAGRSPYLDRDRFTGLTVTTMVRRDLPASARTAEERATAPVVAVPAPEMDLPYLWSMPVRPADPVWPVGLPEPMDRPIPPVVPEAPAESMQVAKRVADEFGPGCGWAFTGQIPPVFDAETAEAEYAQATQAAQRTMVSRWKAWQDAKVTYFENYARYLKRAQAWREYVTEVEQVRAAWAAIQADRDAYAAAMAAYDAAVAAHDQFLVDRREARRDYRDAVQECAAPAQDRAPANQPEPDPSPSPVRQPTPAQPEDPTGAEATSPTGPTTTVPPVEPEPTEPALVCPPPRPDILDQPLPEVPVKPEPPADPRPRSHR